VQTRLVWLLLLLRRRWLLVSILLGSLVVGVVLWLAVVEPSWLLDTRGLTRSESVKARNDLRAILVTMLAGLAVIVGSTVGALSLRETSRQNRAVLQLQHQGQNYRAFHESH
jgi:hypothetical protein